MADLVLLDVVMPGMSGVETAEQIRRLGPGVPIVFMTGFPEHPESLEGELVLQKPFTSLDLIRIIEKILDRQQVILPASHT